MWAVTVTGAPKTWAMQFIEDHEKAPRRWYGGAVGMIGFDGGMNTGLTLRTAHIERGVATVRAGATLLFDSDPDAEEKETELKARALLETLAEAATAACPAAERSPGPPAARSAARRPALACGCCSSTTRTRSCTRWPATSPSREPRSPPCARGSPPRRSTTTGPTSWCCHLGRGARRTSAATRLLSELDARGLPAFGVCLGLQAMVEHAGGELALLPEPAHGKPGTVLRLSETGDGLLAGLPADFIAARYHSLHAVPGQVKGGFTVTAVTPDGAVMAIEDAAAGRWGVQFHPESILTAAGGTGHQVIANVLRLCAARQQVTASR